MNRDILSNFLSRHKSTISWALGILAFFVVLSVVQTPNMDLQTNLMLEAEKKNHAPFDGTTLPVKKTLDWVGLTSAEYTQFKSGSLTYSNAPGNKLVDIPTYDTSTLALDPASLGWSGADKQKRNTLLTYVTAYLGAYTSGSRPAIEGAGSHLAVDIRAPKGTPVYAIANGVVVKTNNGGGNGNSVTILHKNVPSLTSAAQKTNYYSSYLHLDTLSAQVGDVVTKGKLIGTVGDTGIATTYHLHFQIDTADAPFHSYWPFSMSEASAAGLDFFTGVNEGLGKENARRYTINPMRYVYQYMAGVGQGLGQEEEVVTSEPTTPEPVTPIPVEETPVVETPEVVVTPEPVTPDPVHPVAQKVVLQAEADSTVMAGNPARIRLLATDEQGQRITSFQPVEPVRLQAEGIGDLETSSITAFNNGTAYAQYQTEDREEARIRISYQDQEQEVRIAVIDKLNPIAGFEVESSTMTPVVGEDFTLTITTVDGSGQPSPSALYADAQVEIKEGKATLLKNRLRPGDFDNGHYTLLVTPLSAGPLRITVREGAVLGSVSVDVQGKGTVTSSTGSSNTSSSRTTFSDVSKDHPHYKAIMYLKKVGVLEGYADGTFRPDQPVNRAEVLKILLGGSGIQPKTKVVQSSFPDVKEEAWFAVWVERAKDLGIVSGNPDGTFAPASNINGAENLKMALRTNHIVAENLYRSGLDANPYPDVPKDAWFAKAYEYASRKNLVPTDQYGNAYPSKSLTRGEVAEVMYRIMALEKTSAKVYSPDLVIN